MRCVLFGVGSPFVYEVHESVVRAGWEAEALVANIEDCQRPSDLGRVVGLDELEARWRELPVLIPLLTPGYRKSAHRQAVELGFSHFPALVDPTAVVAASAEVEGGSFVNAAAVVGAKSRLGPFSLVNRSASVGHHVTLGELATLGPAATLCGSCRIEAGAFVGAGATVLPEVRIGANSIVGAGAVVTRDVPPHCTVAGNPARVVRKEVRGYRDVSV